MIFNLNPTGAVNVTEHTRGADTATSVAVTTTVAVSLSPNHNRSRYSVYNAGSNTVYIRENATVSATVYTTPIPPGYLGKEDFSGGNRYLGVISVIGAVHSTILVSESSTT